MTGGTNFATQRFLEVPSRGCEEEINLYDFLKFLHVVTAVFMAVPLYNLIVVNERVRFGKAHVQVDQYCETIIRGNSKRC